VQIRDVIVVGAGIIGASLALELRERGASVLVLESGVPGREASFAAAGMLAPADPETPPALCGLAFASTQMYPEFVRTLEEISGIKVDFRRQGTIKFFETASAPPPYRRLSAEELHALEPGISRMPAPHVPFFVAEDTVDPRMLMQATLAAAERKGVVVSGNTEVTGMQPHNDFVEVFAGEQRHMARAVVNCRGAWAGVPVRPRKGQMLAFLPDKKNLLRHVVVAPDVYLVPRSSGRILAGATVEDAGYDKTIEAHTIQKLHLAAARLVPELGNLPVAEQWAGLRPGTPDDLPLLGETSERGIFIAAGHFRNGILLAPVTARIMANLIMGTPAGMNIEAFSPERFCATPVEAFPDKT
jgi:glycine oxidase